MRCATVQKRLSLLADGDLAPEELEVFRPLIS